MQMTLTFSPEHADDLKRLQTLTNAGLEELFNNAFTVLEWTVNESLEQNVIAAVNEREKTYRVLINPLQQRVAECAQERSKKEKVA
ncbi:MAG: hypothetical protein WA672_06355 [Candidatus Angelobacter sp.]